MAQTTPIVRIRSRTGCITCKIRRVKCDEEKPSCRRCRSTGRTCDGYAPSAPPQSSSTGQLPVACSNEIRIIHHTPIVDRPVQMSVFPSWDRPLRADEYQSLEFFHLQTTLCFGSKAGAFLLRSAYHDSSIRLAAMALGSLHRAFLFEQTRYPDTRMQGTQLALRQYNTAIRQGLAQMSGGLANGSVDVILTMCVLFYCFESLQGHFKVALRHVASGLRIMKQQELQCQAVQKKTLLPADVIRSMFSYLESQMLELDDELTSIDQLHPAALKPSNLPPVDSSRDCTLDDLSDNFRLFYNRLLRLMTKSGPAGHADIVKDGEATEIPESVIADYEETQSEIMEWSAALERYFEHHPLEAMDATSRRLAVSLKMWKTLVHVVLKMELPLVETGWDRFTSDLATVVSLAEEVVNISATPEMRKRSPSPTAAASLSSLPMQAQPTLSSHQHILLTHNMPSPCTFSVAQGILPPLWIVATACRDSKTRYRARDLMMRCRRREGLWDSVLFAELASKVARIEETMAGIPEGAPYEPADLPIRARITTISSSFGDGRMVQVKYMGSDSKLLEETLTW
ncbi:hypothetical protein P170DRAFT_498170 [Aspergillus steynii IBT 23096]|uniref:Zn(2)-C6 fungal-type domain-containing protein n=1 Tax=Aspergillus steynii IBT 23096 TaxID=1392250 RepID=A0A2I2G0F8_9EURO|nr:uncharacterized protein P170DRAFT_498170 [Aspergillus steynii IBT 23096]PLB46367.1 hypothetical protein P170DRAFT_498170 [Aspergillus steynii IBT 23096]